MTRIIYKYSKYEIYSSIIERSLKLFGSRFYPTSISSAVILFQKGEDCSDAIKSYINYREQNPLIEFYHSILPFIIQDDTQYAGNSEPPKIIFTREKAFFINAAKVIAGII